MMKCLKKDCEFNRTHSYFKSSCSIFDDIDDCTLSRVYRNKTEKIYNPKVRITKGEQAKLF